MKRVTILGLMLAAPLVGCGGGSGDAPTLTIVGRVHLDDLRIVRSVVVDGHASHGCTVESLKGKQVVISDSAGKKVGVAALTNEGLDDPLPAESADDFYGGAPGTCNLKFKLSVKGGEGVYTAEIEGVPDTSTSFKDSDARKVVIEVK